MRHTHAICIKKTIPLVVALFVFGVTVSIGPVLAAQKQTRAVAVFSNGTFESAYVPSHTALEYVTSSPIAGTASVRATLSAKQKISWNEVRFEKPYSQATALTVTALARSDAKAGRGQLCAVAVYTDASSASRCAALPSILKKVSMVKMQLSLNPKKKVAYVHLTLQSTSKSTSIFTIDNVSGSLTVPIEPQTKTPSTPTSTIQTSPSSTAPTSTSVVQSDRLEAPPASVVLNNGNVLLIGGTQNGSDVNTIAVYTAKTHTAADVGTSAHYGAPLLVVLKNGTVLIAGGYSSAKGHNPNTAIELFSEDTQVVTKLSASLAHAPVSATLLADGSVLFLESASACDVDGHIAQNTAEIYNPITKQVSATKLGGGTVAAALNNNLVLVRGIKGCAANSVVGGFATAVSSDAKLFNPTDAAVKAIAGGSFSGTGNSYAYPNAGRIAPDPRPGLLLKNGTVFFADYGTANGVTVFQSFDPDRAVFDSDAQTLGYDPGVPVYEQSDGKILLVNKIQNTFYLYDPIVKTLVRATPQAINYRGYVVAVSLENKQIVNVP